MKLYTGYSADPANPKAYCRVEQVKEYAETHDYGVTDSKGRAVGGRVYLARVTFHDDETGDTLVPVERLDTTEYRVWFTSHRDGRAFGPSRHGDFPTQKAALAHATKAVARAKARAVKAHAK